MSWLALDVGGANLKVADGLGYAAARPFALWRAPERLSEELAALTAAAPPATRWAVTMTGELADCYSSRTDGVRAILAAVETAAAGRETWIYRTDGRLAPPPAEAELLSVAASNWRALAEYTLRFCSTGRGLLVDIGSTTVDVIPLVDGRVAARGSDDFGRLGAGELVYTGVERTPLCAVVDALPIDGRECPVAAELFATTADAYLLSGDLPEEPSNCDTADGRPRTREHSRRRIGRMLCREVDDAAAAACARRACTAQLDQLAGAVRRVVAELGGPLGVVVLSGHGEFLGRRLLERLELPDPQPRVLSLASELGASASRCAPAHALAVLAREGCER